MFGFTPMEILLVFALYLLARWQHVKRPLFYLVGVGGLVFAMLSGFFIGSIVGNITGSGSSGGATVAAVFQTLGSIVALLGFVAACYGAPLPINIPGDNQKQTPTDL